MNNLALGSGKAALRRKINDAAGMMRIHRIRKPKKKIPAWSLDDKAVRKLLLTSFPKLQTDREQRARAARWNQIIALYFRLNMSKTAVAENLCLKVTVVNRAIQRICFAAAGLRTNGTPRGGKRGRPKKRP